VRVMSEAKNLTMTKKAILVLEDGSVYEGYSFGAETTACGEVVFNTGMTGYQEMLTDPSYAGQILVPTYPLMGNYGINETDFESRQIQVRGLVVREYCLQPSHWQSTITLHKFLQENGVPGISEIDTRALTRHIRSGGVMMGVITSEMTAEEALKELKASAKYDSIDFVHQVSTEKPYEWQSSRSDDQLLSLRAASPRVILRESFAYCHSERGEESHIAQDKLRNRRISFSRDSAKQSHMIVVIDLGLKYNTLRILSELGCRVIVVPGSTSAKDVLALNPDGILLSPGPGNPALLDYIVETVRELLGKKPIMGLGLGQNLMGQALGAKSFKLKFGHHGSYPVRDLTTHRVYITAQNHVYAIDPDTLKGGLEVSHVNLNDGTVEGLRHRDLLLLSVQYHPEASPGPQDNVYLFKRFLDMVEISKDR